MKKQLVSLGLATAMLVSGQAMAQFPPSGGEAGLVLSGFYECKQGPVIGGIPTFQEVTTLMLTNESPTFPTAVALGFMDGNANMLAHSILNLAEEDLDEINICHTLFLNGIAPPSAGKIDIVALASPVGPLPSSYCWMKNVLGKFFANNPEPFQGRVSGIAKTECRVVPEEIAPFPAVRDKVLSSPQVEPSIIENTDP